MPFNTGSITKDFLVEVALGNIPDHELLGFVSRNPNSGVGFEDVWGGGGTMIYPTSAETWEIFSDNANDSLLGAGARNVLITSLDDSLNVQQTIVEMNGVSPVTLSNTHYRPQSAVVISAGGLGSNAGTITLRDQASGNIRNVISPDLGASFDGHLTVPAGKKALILQTFTFFPKNRDGVVRTQARPNIPNPAWVSAILLPLYQNSLTVEVLAKFPLNAGTDVRHQVNSSVAGLDINVIFEYLFVSE